MFTRLPPSLLQKYTMRNQLIRFTLLALLVRILIVSYFVYNSHHLFPERMIGGFIFKMNDYDYFLGTVDNYYKNGTMTYYDQVKPFAGRMPGYGIPYMIIRLFTSQVPGLIILMSLQILLSAMATYVLALISLMIFNSEKIFKSVFWVFAISAPTMIFDIFTLSESFSISAVIFFYYFLFRYCLENTRGYLVLAGFFLAWSIFLRPFLGTMLLASSLMLLLWHAKRDNMVGTVGRMALFLFPFILFESAWITRNYLVLHKFIPLETSLSESYGEDGAYRTSAIGIRSMIHAWGGETGEFYTGSEAWWFHAAKADQIASYTFPAQVFQAGFTFDSLVALKYIFNESINFDRPHGERDSLNMLANSIALRYAADYKANNKARYYIVNPLKMYGRLLFSNGTKLLMMPAVANMNVIEKVIKFFYFFFYLACIIGGIIGMCLFLKSKLPHTPYALLFMFQPWIIATTLVFYSTFVIIESRYLISSFPVFLVFNVYACSRLPFIKKYFALSTAA